MKLLTHNMLKSHVKGAKNGYPLEIHATEVREEEAEYNPEFIKRMMSRIDYAVLLAATRQLNVQPALPDAAPEEAEMTEEFLKAMHHALLQVNVVEGELECPDTGRRFPIKRGVPNLLLNEDEI